MSTWNRTEAQDIYDTFDTLIDKIEHHALRDARYNTIPQQLRHMRDHLPHEPEDDL